MSLRRVCWVVAIALVTWLEISCGQVYRPVVIPVNTTPPNPANFHAVFGISTNAPYNPGTALQIDVSGDTDIGVANMGVNPTHAAVLPSATRIVVASAGSLFAGDSDLVSIFSQATDSPISTGLGTPQTVSLTPGSLPVFVNTTENTAVYVANFGTNSVSAVNTNAVIRQTVPVGSQPVALAETADARNLYVVNQGDNTVINLFPTDLSTVATIPVGSSPVWAVPRVDSKRVYVVTQGDGKLSTIDTTSNVVSGTNSLGGPGANFAVYDKSRNRIYVTNPGTGTAPGAVYVFDATTDPPTPLPLGSSTGMVTIPAPPPCATAPAGTCNVMPVSVAPLLDGSRFYVASYVIWQGPACPDSSVTVPACIIPQITVFDAVSLTLKTNIFPLLVPVGSVQPFALAPVPSCSTIIPYDPHNLSARFRMSAAASVDSTRVYASMCDAGSIAIVNTTTSTVSTGGNNTPDTLVLDLTTPFAACTGSNCGKAANITSFSITSNVVTFQASNNFNAGEQVTISGLTTTAGKTLDGLRLTVLSTGLSGTQFESNLPTPQADVPLTADLGSALESPVANITAFSITSNVVTFQAPNSFTPGERVLISNLSSAAGTPMDGLTLTVLPTGLSGSQFECNFTAADVGLTTDSGSAVPQPLTQNPVFLLSGQ